MKNKELQKLVTTIELEPEDQEAIMVIQAHIKAEYPLYQRGSDIPRRVAISWAIRKAAEDIAKWEERRSN